MIIIMGPFYGKFPPLFPYFKRFLIGSGMGIVWEIYRKGGAIIGGPWKSHLCMVGKLG